MEINFVVGRLFLFMALQFPISSELLAFVRSKIVKLKQKPNRKSFGITTSHLNDIALNNCLIDTTMVRLRNVTYVTRLHYQCSQKGM